MNLFSLFRKGGLTSRMACCTIGCTALQEVMRPMKQLSLTEARAKLSTLVDEVHKGKGPVAIAQRSRVKAVLVDANWHDRVEEEIGYYRRTLRGRPFRLRGTMRVTGDVDRALRELKRERELSLQIDGEP